VAPRVAAVIGNYEGAEHLPACLESLAAQTQPLMETIVVDAGSSDDSVAVARAHGARVIETENRGLGYLYNRGAEAATAELVLLANNDVAFERDCVRLLAEALDGATSRFAADPTQLDWSGESVIHARTVLRRGPLLRTPIPGLRVDPLVRAEDVVPTLCVNAGAMLVQRSMFIELRGFDETFFLDFEDLDLCWRAWAHGWASVYVPSARLRHKVGMSANPIVSPRRLRSSHHNLLRFALKCLPPPFAARVVLGELLRLSRHPGSIGASLVQVARTLPEVLRERAALRSDRGLIDWLLAGQPSDGHRV
jgi:GT2 family glycosyltransferase